MGDELGRRAGGGAMNKPRPLQADELELLLEVMKKRSPDLVELVFERAAENTLARDEREQLCGLLGSEFAETGLDEDSEPTSRGMRLEALLDLLNRPNITS
jgi:hypothetical protein